MGKIMESEIVTGGFYNHKEPEEFIEMESLRCLEESFGNRKGFEGFIVVRSQTLRVK